MGEAMSSGSDAFRAAGHIVDPPRTRAKRLKGSPTKAVGTLVLHAVELRVNKGELEMLRRVLNKYREQAPWEAHPLYDQLVEKVVLAQGRKP